MDDDKFQAMNLRLRNLEEKVYKRDNAEVAENIKVDESLLAIGNKVSVALIGREKAKSVFKRLDEIQRFLNPALGDELTLSDEAKLHIITSQEAAIRERAQQLQQIDELKNVLNSEHIKAVPGMTDKLQSLNHIQIEQECALGLYDWFNVVKYWENFGTINYQEKADEISANVRDLAMKYNTWISLLTQQFVAWDNVVTQAEIARAASSKKSP